MKVIEGTDHIPTVDMVEALIQRFMYSNALDFLSDRHIKALSAYMYQERTLRKIEE